MRHSLIIGANGQDGRLLQDLLGREGIPVLARGRADFDITDPASVRSILSSGVDSVYYLAAHHHSSQDLGPDSLSSLYSKSTQVHVTGLLHFLEAIRSCAPGTRLFYAASSLIFGSAGSEPVDESTPLNPNCIYGITKTCGLHLCRHFRHAHGVFVSAGILFNHESHLRDRKFVIPKIIDAAVSIARGSRQKLPLGDVSARVDWGYAPDYVEAMRRILNHHTADDFVIATGETHSVMEVLECVFSSLNLDWREHVVEAPDILTRKRSVLRGDSSKLRALTGWQPTLDFKTMILRLVKAAQDA
jgi:GDPmannose 4,6-dehydratase